MLTITLVALGLVAGRADSQEAEDPRVMMLELREPVGASATVYVYAGSCGPDRYEVEMRGSDRYQASTMSLRVNGNAVVSTEMNRISALIPPDFYIYEPVVDECLKGARQARVRLLIAGSPSPTPRWLSFLVGSDGSVTGFREEKRAEIEGTEGLPDAVPTRVMTMKRRGRVSPTAILYSAAGSCGRDRYETELRGTGRPAEGSTLSLRVNGHPVAPFEMERVEASIPEGFALDRAGVHECPREVRQARIFMILLGTSSPELRWMSFLVGADGRVTGIKKE